MNSLSNNILSENRALFSARFPDLASLLGLDSEEITNRLLDAIPENYHLENTKTLVPTLSVNNVLVHSKYDPVRDAQRVLENDAVFTENGCLFAGCGLAYLPELYALSYPDAVVILIEPDIFLFLLCLASRPLSELLSHRELIFVIGTPPREVLALLEKIELTDIPVYEAKALTAPNKPWFDEFSALKKRNKEKTEINANTLKRFGSLWLKNMCRNLKEMRDCNGIAQFAGIFTDIPVLVLAAGPSLDRILPSLETLRKHCLIIAVDTAVRACLRSHVEPDFIMLVDPQYWNYRHLDGLECPNSILITEGAAWPAVFRFKCRAIYLCASLFPLGKFLESRTKEKGELGAGGSVSTTAWDFARHLGAKNIYMAGLDLGFPDKKTHFTGSIFEERTHSCANRLHPAETEGYTALYGAGPYPVSNYEGSTVLTDKRLILYAWWFESRLAASKEHRTITLTPEGVRIPGFSVGKVSDITSQREVRQFIETTLASCITTKTEEEESEARASFNTALDELKAELIRIRTLATQGMKICEKKAEHKKGGYASIVQELDQIDTEIRNSTAKEIAAMVFTQAIEANKQEGALESSKKLYRDIFVASEKNINALAKFY